MTTCLIFIIIFESDTPAGRAFDLALIFIILLSVVLVMLLPQRSCQLAFCTVLLKTGGHLILSTDGEETLRFFHTPQF